jgi:hypothetical protein
MNFDQYFMFFYRAIWCKEIVDIVNNVRSQIAKYSDALAKAIDIGGPGSMYTIATNPTAFKPPRKRRPPPVKPRREITVLNAGSLHSYFSADNTMANFLPFVANDKDNYLTTSHSFPSTGSFAERLHDLVSQAPSDVITWDPTGTHCIIFDEDNLCNEWLPKHFDGE